METAKFTLSNLLGIGMTLVVLGIGIAYGMDVLNDARGDLCNTEGYQHYYNGHCYQCDATNTTFIEGNLSCSNGGVDPSSSYVTGAADSASVNATTNAMTGVSKLPEKLPTIVTVIVAAVIIGILVRYLWIGIGQK